MLAYCRNLTLMKLRLKGAQKGHSLLKKKADALTVRFRQILKKIIEVWSFHQLMIFIIVCLKKSNKTIEWS